jgi:hypothetical protein
MPGVQLIVARPGRRPAAVGEPGAIWVRSPLLARGYGTERSSSGRFVEDAFGRGTGRAYRTGDVGRYLPDGEVLVLGRDDDQVKIRSFRVEPAEIESVLLRHPDAGMVAVVAACGCGAEPALVAYVTGTADTGELRRLAAKHLPPQMTPQWFVRTSELPRTVSGKVDRRSLAARELPGPEHGSSRTPPQTATEVGVAEIWRDLLSAGAVNRGDSFFDLGGHSVSAARLTARIRNRFGVALRLSDVFAHPRLHELAACVDTASARLDDDIVGELLDEIRDLSPEELQAILADADASPGSTLA